MLMSSIKDRMANLEEKNNTLLKTLKEFMAMTGETTNVDLRKIMGAKLDELLPEDFDIDQRYAISSSYFKDWILKKKPEIFWKQLQKSLT